MKLITSFVLIVFAAVHVAAAELKISSTEPLVAEVPMGWESGAPAAPKGSFPFGTCRIAASGERNAVCLISVLDKNRPEFTNPEILKRILRGDSRPYLGSAEDAAGMEIKELLITSGLVFYANFIDPDLVGKPIKKGSYKTATPLILSLGSDYLLKITILCDDLKNRDYDEAVQMVKSIKIAKPKA